MCEFPLYDYFCEPESFPHSHESVNWVVTWPQTNQPENLDPQLHDPFQSTQLFSPSDNSMSQQINQPENLGHQLHDDRFQSPQTNQPHLQQVSEAEKKAQKVAKRRIVDKRHHEKKKRLKKETEDQIQNLDETIKTLRGTIGNLEGKIVSLTKNLDEVRSDLEKSESINKDQENLVQDLFQELDHLRIELEKSESELHQQNKGLPACQQLLEFQMPKITMDWTQDSFWTQLSSPWLQNFTTPPCANILNF